MIRKIGKRRQQVVNWQDEEKKKLYGKKCENVKCYNTLGNFIRCEHIAPQGSTKFRHYAMDRRNTRFVCGCVDLDRYGKSIKVGTERFRKAVEFFPGCEEFVREILKEAYGD